MSSGLRPCALLLAVLLFWGLRISYWHCTEEMPFSDMVGLENMARNIRQHLDFSWDPFFQSFVTPTMPALRALQCLILGESLTAWRYLQTALLFGGALWLAYEIFVISRSRWLASLPVVALTPWLNSALFLSLPRMFDPHVPIILFGNLLLAHAVCIRVTRRLRPNTPSDGEADFGFSGRERSLTTRSPTMDFRCRDTLPVPPPASTPPPATGAVRIAARCRACG